MHSGWRLTAAGGPRPALLHRWRARWTTEASLHHILAAPPQLVAPPPLAPPLAAAACPRFLPPACLRLPSTDYRNSTPIALKYVKRGYHVLVSHGLTLVLLPLAAMGVVSPLASAAAAVERAGTAAVSRPAGGT